ncbi:MAG: hypothetical protein AAF704_15620 [Cyanobacteria bacterium P01_D01_bin.123]
MNGRCFVLTVGLSVAVVVQLALEAIAQVPDDLMPCLPAGATEVQVRGTAERDGQIYYYAIGLNAAEIPFVAIAEVDRSGQCFLLIKGSDDINRSLDDVMPYDVAFDLYRQNYERAIELAGSKAELEAIFRADAGGDIKKFRSEAEIAALQELGIEFPDDYTLSSSNPDIQSLIVQFQRFNEPPGPKSINRVEIVGDYAIARWFQFGESSGHYVGQKDEKGRWRAIGFANDAEAPLTAEMLRDRFEVPRRTVRQLMEASES